MPVIEFKRKKLGDDLNALLKKAVNLKSRWQKEGKKTGVWTSLKNFFEPKIMNTLITEKLVEREQILCGLYVAGLLCELADTSPESWYAFDYLAKNRDTGNPIFLKSGANVCFLLYSLFPDWASRRSLAKSYYRQAGISLYVHYYYQTNYEIGYYMAGNFESMARVARLCVNG